MRRYGDSGGGEAGMRTQLPARGISAESVQARMRRLGEKDAKWRAGKTWSLVYFAGEHVTAVLKNAYNTFFRRTRSIPALFPA